MTLRGKLVVAGDGREVGGHIVFQVHSPVGIGEVSKQNDACMFVTLVLGILEPVSGQIEIASAGHEPPVLLKDRPDFLRYEGGPALGLVEQAEFPVHSFTLEEKDVLILYSDGITDALNCRNEFFGEKYLMLASERASSYEPSEVMDGIKAALASYVGQKDLFDDITLLALGRSGRKAG